MSAQPSLKKPKKHPDFSGGFEKTHSDLDLPVPKTKFHDLSYEKFNVDVLIVVASAGLKAVKRRRGRGSTDVRPRGMLFVAERRHEAVSCFGLANLAPRLSMASSMNLSAPINFAFIGALRRTRTSSDRPVGKPRGPSRLRERID